MIQKEIIARAAAAYFIFGLLVPNAKAKTCCGGQEISDPLACCNGQAYEEAIDKACCHNLATYNPQFRKKDYEFPDEAFNFVKSKLEGALENIPNIGGVTATGEAKYESSVADCCPDEGPPVSDGLKRGSATTELKVGVSEFCLWPPGGAFNREFAVKLFIAKFRLKVSAGAFISFNHTSKVTLGAFEDICNDFTCYDSGISTSDHFDVFVRADIFACASFLWFDEHCFELSATPIGVSLDFAFSGDYKSCRKPDKWDGTLDLGPVVLYSEIKYKDQSQRYEWPFGWKGYHGKF